MAKAPKKATKKAAKTYKGKSMKLGGGGRFKKGADKLTSEGYSKEAAGAIMASAGRKKYGGTKMAKMSGAARKKK